MPTIATLSRDVFFGMRIRTVLQQLGYELLLCNTEQTLVDQANQASLVIVDFNQPVEWTSLQPVMASDPPVIAFGSHTNVEGFRVAKEAGVTRTISNGEFSRKLPDLLAHYLPTAAEKSGDSDSSTL